MAEERKIRQATADASERFAETYAMVAIPKVVVANLNEYLNDKGIDLDLIDDGEDDGVPAFLAVLRSSALDKPIRNLTASFWVHMALFLGASLIFVIGAATQVAWLVNACAAMMAFTAVRALQDYRLADLRRAFRATLKKQGL